MRILLYIAVFVLLLLPALAYAGDAEDFVRREITSMLPWDANAVEVDDVDIPGLKAGKGARLNIDVPKRPSGPGKVSFKLEVSEKGMDSRVFWGSARVMVYKDAVVALRPMKGKTLIGAQDVKLARVALGEASESFSSIDEVAGMVAKRPISAGAVIKKNYVKEENVIRRGEKVAVSVEGPTIRIRSRGIAAEDGHVGSVITVKTDSGREVAGEVRGPGEIVIKF